MSLPKRNIRHQYDFKLSNGKKIKFTPWLVRHEQEFMYATEGLKDKSEIVPHIEELLSKCVVEELDFALMTDTDFLKLAIEVRKKSKGSDHEVVFRCPHCQTPNDEVFINLDEDIVSKPFDYTPIEVSDLVFVPQELSRGNYAKLKDFNSSNKKKFMYVVYSIKSVTVGDDSYTQFTEKDVENFLGTELTNDEYTDLARAVLKRSSTLAIEKKHACVKCAKDILVYVDDITDFFV